MLLEVVTLHQAVWNGIPKSFFCLFGEAPSRKILTFWPKFRHILGKKSLIKNNFTPSCRMSEFLSKCVWKISVGVCIFVECVWKLSEFKFVLKVLTWVLLHIFFKWFWRLHLQRNSTCIDQVFFLLWVKMNVTHLYSRVISGYDNHVIILW